MRWKVDVEIEVLGRWLVKSQAGLTERTTGSPYFRASIDDGAGNRVYDQGDGTFDTPDFHFPLVAHVAGLGFRSVYTPSEDAAGHELTIEVYHPSSTRIITDSGWVSGSSIDDLVTTVTTADVEFEDAEPVP